MKTRIISFCLSAILILGVLSQTAIGAEGPDSAEYPPTSQDDSSYQEGETSEEENDPVKPHLPAVDLNRLLNTEEHSAYIQGSEDFVKPDGPLTRAEAATMIYSLLREQPQELKATFPDVSETDWFYRPVLTLATLGAISGTPDGEYKPHSSRVRYDSFCVLSNVRRKHSISRCGRRLLGLTTDCKRRCQRVDQWISRWYFWTIG